MKKADGYISLKEQVRQENGNTTVYSSWEFQLGDYSCTVNSRERISIGELGRRRLYRDMKW
jgi:hypothetical protein